MYTVKWSSASCKGGLVRPVRFRRSKMADGPFILDFHHDVSFTPAAMLHTLLSELLNIRREVASR